MISVIVDGKGTGKTRQLIQSANSLVNETLGNIVFIDNNKRHMYELNYKIRFADTSEFKINEFCMFYGFICGIISGDFDISNIYIDGVFDIVKDDDNYFEDFLNNIESIAKKFDINFVMTLTGNADDAPEYLKKYM